jgi:hypothetical protein
VLEDFRTEGVGYWEQAGSMPSSAKALLCNGVGRVVMTIFACGLTGVEVML